MRQHGVIGRLTVLFCSISLLAAKAAHAQCEGCPVGQAGEIRVVRSSLAGQNAEVLACFSAESDFTLNLDQWAGWDSAGAPQEWLLRVYDCGAAGTPTHDIGRLIIEGDPVGILRLAVLVASPTQAWSDRRWSWNSDLPMGSACIDFGGLEVSDPDLLARTRASVAISGNVTRVSGPTAPDPDLHANQFVRVQAEGTATGGGVIDGDIIAEGASPPFYPAGTVSHHFAIGSVRVKSAIRGTIRAVHHDIASVRVVGNPTTSTPEGISGDILAYEGSIGSIVTSGPIARTGGRPQIIAGDGIGSIKAAWEFSEPTTGVVEYLDLDFDFDLLANKIMADDPAGFPYSTAGIIDGVLELVQTGGDIAGSIRAGNLTCRGLTFHADNDPNTIYEPRGECGKTGIYSQGVCSSPIDLDLTMYLSNIIARTYTADIVVGRFAIGAIVAVGGATTPDPAPPGYADGRIPFVQVGRATLPAAAEQAVYGQLSRGLCGLFNTPFVPRDPQTQEIDPDLWFVEEGHDDGAIDAVIHAEGSIGEADVASLTLVSLISEPCNKFPPAVEAPHIDELNITYMGDGSVWSGDHAATTAIELYAQVDALSIGSTRRNSAIWIKDWGSAVIAGNAFGDIHVPEVPASLQLTIGGALGDEANPGFDLEDICGARPWVMPGCELCFNYFRTGDDEDGLSQRPRNPDYPVCTVGSQPLYDDRGQIRIAGEAGLHGQVTINAAVTGMAADLLWSGAVQVGADASNCPLLEVSPTPSSPEWESPHYDGLSAALGGGAIGLVPFALHRTDCDPPADADPADRTFLNSAFCHIPFMWSACLNTEQGPEYDNAFIVLDFYGPISRESELVNPYEIGIDGPGGLDWSVDYGQWTQCSIVSGPGGGAARRLVIHGTEFPQLLGGHYFIRPRQGVSASLLCDGLLPGASDTPVADFLYEFWLLKDCNTNGIPDHEEDPGFCCIAYPCDPDYDGDGNADQADVLYLNNVISGGPNPTQRDPDFNRDGNVDQEDIAALIDTISSGVCP
jgi:hypothetical protein